MKAGLIKGRHEMPVDDYIITDEINADLLSKDNLSKLTSFVYEQIDKFIQRHKKDNLTSIDLFLTGLSRIQHLTIKRLLAKYVKEIYLFDYDKDSNEYFIIERYTR